MSTSPPTPRTGLHRARQPPPRRREERRPTTRDFTPPPVIAGRYRMLEEVGIGATSSVYRAMIVAGIGVGSEVAVKVLHPYLGHQPAAWDRMHREAQLLSRVRHPGCVRVLDWGVDRVPFIVMDLVRGENLGALMALPGRLDVADAVSLARAICCALEAAHDCGVVHRDLKPCNIMLLGRGGLAARQPVLLDFGLAKQCLDGSPDETLPRALTKPGIILGTPSHMAPEQLTLAPIDHRVDIYACGVLLYEMLTGALPLDATCSMTMIAAVVANPPRPPRQLVPDLPAELEHVILRCLEKDPNLRWQSIRELDRALAPFGLFGDEEPTTRRRRRPTALEVRDAGRRLVYGESSDEISLPMASIPVPPPSSSLEAAWSSEPSRLIDTVPGARRPVLPSELSMPRFVHRTRLERATGQAFGWLSRTLGACKQRVDDLWRELQGSDSRRIVAQRQRGYCLTRLAFPRSSTMHGARNRRPEVTVLYKS
jgi:serine/threonine protein kinase